MTTFSPDLHWLVVARHVADCEAWADARLEAARRFAALPPGADPVLEQITARLVFMAESHEAAGLELGFLDPDLTGGVVYGRG